MMLKCTRAMARRLAQIFAGKYDRRAWSEETARLLSMRWIVRKSRDVRTPGLGGGMITTTLVDYEVTDAGRTELRKVCASCFARVPERPARRSCTKRRGHWCVAVVDPYPEGVM